VAQRARHQLTRLVVLDLLEQRLAHALSDTAVALAIDHHRIQHAPTIVDRQIAHQSYLAGVAIDLDHRQVHAEWERFALRLEEAIRLESGFIAFWHVAVVRTAGNRRQRGRAVRHAAHPNSARAYLDVTRRCLQRIRRNADD